MDPPGYVMAKQVVYPASNADNAWGDKPSTISDWLDAVAEAVEPLLSSTPQHDTTVVINDYGIFGSTIGLAWVGTVCTSYSNNRYRYSVNTGGESSLPTGRGWSAVMRWDTTWHSTTIARSRVARIAVSWEHTSIPMETRVTPKVLGATRRFGTPGRTEAAVFLRSVDYAACHTRTLSSRTRSRTPRRRRHHLLHPPLHPLPPRIRPGMSRLRRRKSRFYLRPPPWARGWRSAPVTDGTTKYVQTVIGVGGVTVSFFTTATRSAFLLAVIEYLNLEGRPVRFPSSPCRPRLLRVSPSVAIIVGRRDDQVNAATDTEEAALITALAPAKGPQLTSALQTELPQINA